MTDRHQKGNYSYPTMFDLFEHLTKNILQLPGANHQSRADRPYIIRPLKRTDTPLLEIFLRHLSTETLTSRFFVGRVSLSEYALKAEIERIYRVSKTRGSIMIAAAGLEVDATEEIIGLGEMVPASDLYHTAELALMVRDDWQGEGIGSELGHRLIEEARRKGIRTLQAETLGNNQAILHMWSRMGLSFSFQTSQNVTTMLALLAPK